MSPLDKPKPPAFLGAPARRDPPAQTPPRNPATTLLLVIGNLRQDGRLELGDGLSLFFFLLCVDRLSGRVDEPRRYEDDEVAFDVLLGVGAEESTDEREYRQ